MKTKWPTKKEDMADVQHILDLHAVTDTGKGLIKVEPLPDGGTIQFTPASWLGDLTRVLIKRHGQDQGLEVLRLVLREIGLFNGSSRKCMHGSR